MSRVLVIASRAARFGLKADLLRVGIVSGCALALILAKLPFAA